MKKFSRIMLAIVFLLSVTFAVKTEVKAENTPENALYKIKVGAMTRAIVGESVFAVNPPVIEYKANSATNVGPNVTVEVNYYEIKENIEFSDITDFSALEGMIGYGKIVPITEDKNPNAVFEVGKKYLAELVIKPVADASGKANYEIEDDVYANWGTVKFTPLRESNGGSLPDNLYIYHEMNIDEALNWANLEIPYDFVVGEKTFSSDFQERFFDGIKFSADNMDVLTKSGRPIYLARVDSDFDEKMLFASESPEVYMGQHVEEIESLDESIVKSDDRFLFMYMMKVTSNDVYLDKDFAATFRGKEVYATVDNDYFGMIVILNAEDFTYEFLEETGNPSITAGNATELVFHIAAPVYNFESFKIGDLELIKDEDYTLAYGSTVISLTDKGLAKVNELSEGNYDIKVTFVDGKKAVLGSLQVAPKPADTPTPDEEVSPKTADTANAAMLLAIMAMAGCVAVVARKRA